MKSFLIYFICFVSAIIVGTSFANGYIKEREIQSENSMAELNEDLSSDVKSVHSANELENLINWNIESKNLQDGLGVRT